MSLHKHYPKLKYYRKFFFLFKKKKNSKLLHLTIKKKFFSPDVTYLTTLKTRRLDKFFSLKLETRQKLKFFYGFYKTQLLKKIVHKKLKKKRYSLQTLEFCSLLERRLDILLFQIGFTSSIYEAKQIISHKKVRINNHATGAFSRLLKPGDIISFEVSLYPLLEKNLKKNINYSSIFLLNSKQIEINYKLFKIIILNSKIHLFSQIPKYNILINWLNL